MAKRTRLPWFPLFAETWLNDEAVQDLSPPERDAYLVLLCLQWRDGDLPFDCIKMLSKLPQKVEHAAAIRVLEGFFPPDPDTNRRANTKLLAIRARQEAGLKARRAGAAKTNSRKHLHGDRDGDRPDDRADERPQNRDESFSLREKGFGKPEPPTHPPVCPARSLDAAVGGQDPEPIQDIVWRVIADLPANRESHRDS